MIRIFILLIGLAVVAYIGFFSYHRFLAITFASGNINYYEGAKNAKPTSLMVLKNCITGEIPLLSSIYGEIQINPRNARLRPDGKLRIINADSVEHTIGIAFTKVWETVEPGDALEITYEDLKKPGSWGVTCDGVNLGEKAPTIVLEEF